MGDSNGISYYEKNILSNHFVTKCVVICTGYFYYKCSSFTDGTSSVVISGPSPEAGAAFFPSVVFLLSGAGLASGTPVTSAAGVGLTSSGAGETSGVSVGEASGICVGEASGAIISAR